MGDRAGRQGEGTNDCPVFAMPQIGSNHGAVKHRDAMSGAGEKTLRRAQTAEAAGVDRDTQLGDANVSPTLASCSSAVSELNTESHAAKLHARMNRFARTAICTTRRRRWERLARLAGRRQRPLGGWAKKNPGTGV